MAVQAGTGLFSNDDIFTEGPLFDRVGKATSDNITIIHLANAKVLFIVIAVHLAAIWLHWRQGENLIPPMIHGRKTVAGGDAQAGGAIAQKSPLRLVMTAILCAAFSAGAVYWILTG